MEENVFDRAVNACMRFASSSPPTNDPQTVSIVWWTNVICLPTIAVVGLACNMLNILILTSNRAAKRMPSWHLLLALAVFDCLFLLFATLEFTPMSIAAFASSPAFNYLYTHSVLYLRMLASTFYKSSILLVVAFNLERYICVCHPMHAHRVCTPQLGRAAVTVAFVSSVICSVQWPLCYEIRECVDEHQVHQVLFYAITISDSETLQVYYRITDYLSLIGFNILPIVTLLLLNCRLLATLKRVASKDDAFNCERRESLISEGIVADPPLNGRTAQRLNANAMLFAVVALLVICVGPQAPARILFEMYGAYHPKAILYTCITQQLVFLNAALNFCLYCLVSKRYRSLLRQTVKRLCGDATRYHLQLMLARVSKSSSVPSSEDHHGSRKASHPALLHVLDHL